jgi:hypothetical protein
VIRLNISLDVLHLLAMLTAAFFKVTTCDLKELVSWAFTILRRSLIGQDASLTVLKRLP